MLLVGLAFYGQWVVLDECVFADWVIGMLCQDEVCDEVVERIVGWLVEDYFELVAQCFVLDVVAEDLVGMFLFVCEFWHGAVTMHHWLFVCVWGSVDLVMLGVGAGL